MKIQNSISAAVLMAMVLGCGASSDEPTTTHVTGAIQPTDGSTTDNTSTSDSESDSDAMDSTSTGGQEGSTTEEGATTEDSGSTTGAAVCGNGVVEPGEDCDDGNQEEGDACDPNCQVPSDLCLKIALETNFQPDPVDVIVLIDTSMSMSEEVAAAESSIQVMAEILAKAGLDFRIILLASYGNDVFEVCIKPPLSGLEGPCFDQDYNHVNSQVFFHFDATMPKQMSQPFIDSNNGWCRLMQTWGEWSKARRMEAEVAIVFLSDDDANCSSYAGPPDERADTFHMDLSSNFGFDAQIPGYRYHAIVGVADKEDGTPYGPEEPLVDSACSTAENAGRAHQHLSKASGGLRFPICDVGAYDPVFEAIGEDVKQQSLECSQELGSPPKGKYFDLDSLALFYTPNKKEGEEILLHRVDTAQGCSGDDEYYVEGSPQDTLVLHLCPETCVQAIDDPYPFVYGSLGCSTIPG